MTKTTLRLLMALMALVLVATACHDEDNPPNTNGNVKAADGLDVTLPGLGSDVCHVEWNEYGETDGSSHVTWRAVDNDPDNLDGCASVRACLIYTIPGTNPIESDERCTALEEYPASNVIGRGSGLEEGADARDARIELVAQGALVDVHCHLFNTDANIDPGNACPPALPLP